MKIQIETIPLENKEQEKELSNLINKFKCDLDLLGLKVTTFNIPKFNRR